MNLKNAIKSLKLRLSGGHLGKWKLRYQLSLKDLFIKLFTKSKSFEVSCVLCGFPRTGTHWIRNVVQQSTGQYCPSLDDVDYNKIELNKKIPLFKIHARSKFISRLKLFFKLPPHKFDEKYIYVYRDPRDAIISLYNMYNILKNKNLSQKQFLHDYDPIGQFKWEINSWVLGKSNSNTLIVRFEDLKINTFITFKNIFSFIGLQNDLDEHVLNEYVGVVEDNKRIKGEVYGWKKTYSEYEILIDEINKKLNSEIKALKYDEF